MRFPKAAVYSLEVAWVDHPAWGQGRGCVDPSGPLRRTFGDKDISYDSPSSGNSSAPGVLPLTLSTSRFSVPPAQIPNERNERLPRG